jgi:dTMP kinase
VPLSPEDIQRLNEEFNEVAARCSAELQAAEDDRRRALIAVPAGRAAWERFEEAVTRANAAAAKARADADAGRQEADAKAEQTRAQEENAAYAAFLANHAESIRDEAKRKANEECDRCLRKVGHRIPPVSGTELDAERKRAFRQRDAAHRAADEACEEALRKGRDALAKANQAALTKYMDSADAAARQHEQARAAVERALQEAIASANDAFGNAVRADQGTSAIERAYAQTRHDIERRAETQKQDIFRRLNEG